MQQLIVWIFGFRKPLWRLCSYLMGPGCCFRNGKHCNCMFSQKKRTDTGGGHDPAGLLPVSGARTRSRAHGALGRGSKELGRASLGNQVSQLFSTRSPLPFFAWQRLSEAPSANPSLTVVLSPKGNVAIHLHFLGKETEVVRSGVSVRKRPTVP